MCAVCICILCGIPASGKTSLAKRIIHNINSNAPTDRVDHQSDNKGDETSLCCQKEYLKLTAVHIPYDSIITNEKESDILQQCNQDKDQRNNQESLWKQHRNYILICLDHTIGTYLKDKAVRAELDSLDIPADIKEHYTGVVLEQVLKCGSLKREPVVFIVDDNMYYSSMRYQYYQLARKYELGFVQVCLRCKVDTALKRNQERSVPVNYDVIKTMATKIEYPDIQGNPWEKNSITFNEGDNIDIAAVVSLIQSALCQPVKNTLEQQHQQREEARVMCFSSLIHQADQVLRRLVSDSIRDAKRKLTGLELKNHAKMINTVRTQLLTDMKAGVIMVPESIQVQNASRDVDSSLYQWLTHLFHSQLTLSEGEKLKPP